MLMHSYIYVCGWFCFVLFFFRNSFLCFAIDSWLMLIIMLWILSYYTTLNTQKEIENKGYINKNTHNNTHTRPCIVWVFGRFCFCSSHGSLPETQFIQFRKETMKQLSLLRVFRPGKTWKTSCFVSSILLCCGFVGYGLEKYSFIYFLFVFFFFCFFLFSFDFVDVVYLKWKQLSCRNSKIENKCHRNFNKYMAL